MWIVRWSIIGAIILTLSAMIMINTDPIDVSLFGLSVKVPIYMLLYSFFAVGMIIIAIKHKVTNKLELYWNRKELDELRKERDWSFNELTSLFEEIDWYREEIWNLGGSPDLLKSLKIKEKASRKSLVDNGISEIKRIEDLRSKSQGKTTKQNIKNLIGKPVDSDQVKVKKQPKIMDASATEEQSSSKIGIEQKIIPVSAETPNPSPAIEADLEETEHELAATEIAKEANYTRVPDSRSDTDDKNRSGEKANPVEEV